MSGYVDRLGDGTPIWWAMCACYVWPLPLGTSGRCGRCGERAGTLVDRPASGKATPLPGCPKIGEE